MKKLRRVPFRISNSTVELSIRRTRAPETNVGWKVHSSSQDCILSRILERGDLLARIFFLLLVLLLFFRQCFEIIQTGEKKGNPTYWSDKIQCCCFWTSGNVLWTQYSGANVLECKSGSSAFSLIWIRLFVRLPFWINQKLHSAPGKFAR